MSEGSFECVKYAYRQSKDGFVLSFVVHPNDMPDVLATAPIGSRFMIGFASLGDAPTREDGDRFAARDAAAASLLDASPNPSGPTPQLDTGPAEGGAANTGASAAPPSKPNSTRAVMMAKDAEVRAYLKALFLTNVDDEHVAESLIKKACGVGSKSHLNEGQCGAAKFDKFRSNFYAWRNARQNEVRAK